MIETVHSINTIVTNPNVRNGRPIIAGTTLAVMDVVAAHLFHNQDADGIAAWYGITLGQAYAALSYYYDHKAEIDADLRKSIQEAEQMKEQRVGSYRPTIFG